MRLINAVSVFMAEWPTEGAATDTVRSYGRALAWLCKFAEAHGKADLADLSPSLVRAGVAALLDERSTARAPNYKGGEAAAALLVHASRRLARWLLAQGVPVADLSVVKPPRVPERIQPRLYDDEFDRLEAAILRRLINGTKRIPHVVVRRDLALINTLAETGLRAQELCRMQLDHVDFERGWIAVRRGKGHKERIMSVVGTSDDADPHRVLRLLHDWIEARDAIRAAAQHRYLWTSVKGKPLTPDELRRVLASICIEAGIDGSRPPHAFRRYSFTEHYRDQPGSIRRLAARMGWSEKSHKMISTYTHGVELELAQEPIPLLSTRRPDPKVLVSNRRLSAVFNVGVGPPGGVKLNEPPLTPRVRVARERPASQAPLRRPAPTG